MRLKRSWAGTTHAISGTHVAGLSGNGSKAEVATGRADAGAGTKHLKAPLPRWMLEGRGACNDKPTNWWFGSDLDEGGEYVVTAGQANRAAELCRSCPFELDCADHGLRHEGFGMWGGIVLNGLTGTQRDDRLAGVERERRRRSP